ncbi:putative ATP-dependent RNA helicase spindle-E [Haematobia irritans]|uniref:putative ATP-dependent RNA helicase spindle-E n=1 Tax=Haematobia irritans TaxID=7368 RepID=UPI003F507B9E
MDEIEDFFNISKEFKRVSAPAPKPMNEPVPSTSRKIKRENDSPERKDRKLPKLEKDDDDRKSSRNFIPKREPIPEDVDVDFDGIEERQRKMHLNVDNSVYDRYTFNLERDTSLPIHDAKDEILSSVRKNPVVILEGDTGCGKTTQVPQYILDDAYRRREYCQIICTQPRRIAAISIAKRVCHERKWEEGSIVGYKVGLHANTSDDTRLLYCTTGVLLQKLIRDKTLTPYTHIILDEVHERDQEMDFLLIVVRRLLFTNSKHVKIILMSATMDTTEFAKYFAIRKKPAPVVRADTRRLFQVKEFYLDDLKDLNTNNVGVELERPGISTDMYHLALKLIVIIDNIEKQEASLNPEFDEFASKASILIFLPGINDIEQMLRKIELLSQTNKDKVKIWCLRLHSVVSPDEQVKVFHRPPTGYRKVILATNIAESSITVPDVKYVVDFCLTKVLVTDTVTSFTTLQLNWASKANCRQRSGRAGRVMNGRVYRLIPKTFYQNYLDEFSVPEMLRCPLESVVLKAKLLDMGPPPSVLSLAMDPPNLNYIHNTILTLKELGALYKCTDGIYVPYDGDLSYIGRIMANLPLDVRLSRLIIFGYIFSSLEETIIIAAGLSVRSIFRPGSYKQVGELKSYIQKLKWVDGSASDLIGILNAYREWLSIDPQDDNSQYEWANRKYINLRSIREMHLLVQELQHRLAPYGIKIHDNHKPTNGEEWEKSIILKIIIAGAFYPNYFTYSKIQYPEKERDSSHILCGQNPNRTVFFTNFDTRHIGQLYSRSIKELFKYAEINPNNIEVSFQANCERVLVIFKEDLEHDDNDEEILKTPGSVCAEIYKAIRMRTLNLSNAIEVMEPRSGVRYAEDHGLGTMYDGAWKPNKRLLVNAELIVLPSVFQKDMSGYITHIETCSKFYFQPLSEMVRINEIQEILQDANQHEGLKFPHPRAIAKGMILAAPFDGKYHRAKVIKINNQASSGMQCKVFFIDYGNMALVNFGDLRYLSETCKYLADIPPRLFECRLAMVEPSTLKSPNGKWTDAAMEYMQEHADSGVVEIEVFSVVDGVSNVLINKDGSTINHILVEKGLARNADESFMSKMDHDFRIRKQSVANRFLEDDHTKQNEEYLRSIRPEIDLDCEPPPRELCTRLIKLRGPFSPLELNVFSAIRVGAWKTVQIDRESVNSVNIDSDPHDMYERLIVAAGFSETANGDALLARGTTKMPNMHGFSALMTMLFCPTMQIKRNKFHTKYTALLAGLGFEENTYKSLYGEHDIVHNLDVDILPDDIDLINEIRSSMDKLLYAEPKDERPKIHPKEIYPLRQTIRILLLRLLSKQRKYIEIHVDVNDNKWEILDKNEVTNPDSLRYHRSIFPCHPQLRLYDEKFERIHKLNMQCHELHRLRQFDGTIPATTCQLCDMPIDNIVQLRIHLLSQMHRDREHQIQFQPST